MVISASDNMNTLVRRDRLLAAAIRLIAAPSPTGDAAAAAGELASLLDEAACAAERVAATHPSAPAVVAWLDSGKPGPVLQFNGHLDVVHLPFVPPRVEGNLLRGSGAADMKAGVAAALEAFLAINEAGGPPRGRLLFTAHDLHEAPWGDGAQLDTLITQGLHGDAVLIPEPLCTHIPLRGRGQACWLVKFERAGAASHELLHPPDQGHPAEAAVDLAKKLYERHDELWREADPVAGRSTIFIGQIHAGALYNQSPREAWLEGTRRWVPGVDAATVECEMRRIFEGVARQHDLLCNISYRLVRDAFQLEETAPIVAAFQSALTAVTGSPLAFGPKPFVDDGNSFSALAKIPAITHGPRAGGQHTTEEWVDIDDLVRVARVYVATAHDYWNSWTPS